MSGLGRDLGQTSSRCREAGKNPETGRVCVAAGPARYPIERKTHQSLLAQHLRNVGDRSKKRLLLRLISTSFSIICIPAPSLFLPPFYSSATSRSRYHAVTMDIFNYVCCCFTRIMNISRNDEETDVPLPRVLCLMYNFQNVAYINRTVSRCAGSCNP